MEDKTEVILEETEILDLKETIVSEVEEIHQEGASAMVAQEVVAEDKIC